MFTMCSIGKNDAAAFPAAARSSEWLQVSRDFQKRTGLFAN
jgi:hypothetical protein